MSEEVIEVGTARASPKSRANGFLKVGESPDGTPINVPVIILNGSRPGRVIWMHALEDGNEYPGSMACMELARLLAPKVDEIKGAIVMIPAVNVTAFRGNPWGGGIRNSPADLDGGIAFPRQYPGNPDGGFSAQAAASIWTPLTKYANYFITFHGSGEMFGIDRILLQAGSTPAYEESAKLARAFGMQVILKTGLAPPDPNRPKSHTQRLIESGIPSMSAESNGGPDGIGLGSDSASLVEGSLNVFRYLGVVPGEFKQRTDFQEVTYKAGGAASSATGVVSSRAG